VITGQKERNKDEVMGGDKRSGPAADFSWN